MKHLLTFLVVFASFLSYSQVAAITSPDQIICACDNAILSSSTSTPGGSPIVRTIWSINGPGPFNFADTTTVGTNLTVQLCNPGTYDISIINQHQNGTASVAQAVGFITVNPKPVAGINVVVNSCTVPFGVTYSNQNPVPGITAAWTFESGNPATFNGDNPPLQSYNTAGDYDVTLIVTDAVSGCKDTAFRTINVSNFDADIILPTAPLCEGELLQFTDNSTVGANVWNWTFENGSPASSNSQNPSASFPVGTHDITLSSSNTSIGCNGLVTMQITVLAKPVPDFTVSPTTGCAPLSVNFTNNNIQAGATYVWNYGDGTNTFTGANSPAHMYLGNGSFTPSVTMTGSNGCSQAVNGTPIVLTSPLANFRLDEKNGCQGLTVTFTDLSTSPAPITNWFWDFGDGGTSTLQHPTHVYNCGEFDVRLIIVIQGGCRDTIILSQDDVSISGANGLSTVENPNLGILQNQVLKYGTHTTPDFFVDHHNDCIKKPFVITDITDIACPHGSDDIIRSWLLNLVPDGTDSVFTKTFPDTMQNSGPNNLPGTDIGLIINFRGCIDTTLTVDSIYISAPISKFALSGNLFCDINQQPTPLNKTVTIDDSQSIYGHKWLNNASPLNPQILDSNVANAAFDRTEVTFRWGDGTSDFYQTNAQGVFDNALTGIEDDLDHASNVDPANPTLNATTTANPFRHTFNDYGTFEVWQIIKNYNSMNMINTPIGGCEDSTMIVVNVSWVSTDYVFDMTPDEVCINNAFTMTSTSATHGLPTPQTNPHTPLSYNFDMGAGGFVTGSGSTVDQTFTHTYFTPGVYNVLLTTTNAVGCSATATHPVTAYALPIANFTLNQVDGCVGIQYTSTATNTSTHPPGSFGAGGSPDANWAATDAFNWTISPNGGTVTNPTTDLRSETISSPINNTTTFSLFVIDGFGCQSAPVSVTANVNKPDASIALPGTACNGTSVDAVAVVSGNQPIQMFWYLDTPIDASPDGTGLTFTNSLTSSGLSQTHDYILVAIDAGGCPDTAFASIVISKPVADFTFEKFGGQQDANGDYVCPPVVVNFTNTSQTVGSIISTEWHLNTISPDALPALGDVTSTEANPQGIQFLFAGTYDVSLVIEDNSGCRDTMSIDDFIVIQGPSADPVITEIPTDCNQTFTFNLLNQNNVASWSWDLGNGQIVSSADSTLPFTVVYSGVQTYTPIVTVVDGVPCPVPYTQSVTIDPNGVLVDFNYSPQTDIGLGTVVTFDETSSSTPGETVVTWDWNFGDGTNSSFTDGSDVTHQYYIGGDVPVTLVVTDSRGCTNEITKFLTVDVKFAFPNVFTGAGSDGPNAELHLFADIFNDFEIMIVNRWGNVVFEGKRDAARPKYLWDGIDQKSGKLCNDGTYFYKMKGILKNDVPIDIHGFVTLIATTRP